MGWRAAAAANAAGTYKGGLVAGQEEAGFALGFANAFSKGMDDFISAKRAKEKDERDFEQAKELAAFQEQLLRTRPRTGVLTEAEKRDRDQLAEAQAFSTQHGVSLPEAYTILESHNWNSDQAGDRLTLDRGTGMQSTNFVPDGPASNSADQNPVEVPNIPTQSVPTIDDLEATEPDQTSALPQPNAAAIRLASRGDTMTDVPIQWVSEADLVSEEPAEVRVAEAVTETVTAIEKGDADAPTYEDVVASGATPPEATAFIAEGTKVLPEAFRMPEMKTITSLDAAKAALAQLDARRSVMGGRDDYDRSVRPILEAKISSLTELPDLGSWLQDDNRDLLGEYVTTGWRQFEGVVPAEDLQAHVQRATELLSQAQSMPSIPASLEDLRNMTARVASGEFGSNLPTEWQTALNTALREAEIRNRFADKLDVTYLTDDDRSVRELTGLLRIVEGQLGSDNQIAKDIQLAIDIKNEMPDLSELPTLADVRSENWQALEAQALALGDPQRAAEIRQLGEGMADKSADRADIWNQVSQTLARTDVIDEATAAIDGFINLSDSAYRLTKIVADNDGMLTVLGGTLPAAISRIDAELSALATTLGQGGASATQASEKFTEFEADIQSRLANNEIDRQAAAVAMYRAQEARLAYILARVQQGPAGVISNQDYNSAIQQIRSSVKGDVFEKSLRNLINADLAGVQSAIDTARNDSQVRIVNNLLNDAGLEFEPLAAVTRDLSETAAARGVAEAYDWVVGDTTLIKAPAPEEAPAPENRPIPNQPAIEMLLNDPTLAPIFDQGYGPGTAAKYLSGNGEN